MSRHLWGSLLVLSTGVMFSFGALFFRWTDDITAWEYLTTRALGATAATALVFSVQNRGRRLRVLGGVEPAHVVAGVIIGLMFCIFIVALTETTAAFILFFQALSPITAAVCSWFLLRERMSRPALVATAVSLIGVGIMVNGGIGSQPGWTIPLVLGIPVGFGFYTTLIRVGGRVDPLVPVIVGGLTALIVSVVATLLEGGYDASARDLAIGFVAGVALLGIPLPVFNFASRDVPAPESSLLLMSEVVLAPVWVWLFVDETPADATLVGGVVILAAVTWLILQSSGRARGVRTSRG